MIDLAQADPTLRAAPRQADEGVFARHVARVRAIAAMTDEQYADWQSLERYVIRWGFHALTRFEQKKLRELRELQRRM